MNPIEVFQWILESQKIGSICICAGSRNAPLIEMAAGAKGIPLFSFFDERSAAFFSLGRAKIHPDKWAAVLTTSGTAVAELLPALIEAHYEGLPLLSLTADRPKNFRGTGAPQSIDQFRLLGAYGGEALDINDSFGHSDFELLKEKILKPRESLHLNFCLGERG